MTLLAAPSAVDSAVDARGGADLLRFSLSDRIPDAAFKANGDGTITITGVDLLKAGVFNGYQILSEDLDAVVARFGQLSESGTFVPPFRLDHSWSVLSVVGYFANLETYARADLTGVENTFLRGDVILTGSLDYDPATIVAAIKRGALRNRSAELGPYLTNAGVELPLVFYGAAFVDIPAVEGLAPVALSRAGLRPVTAPHSIRTLSATEGTADMTDQTPETPTPEETATSSTGETVPTDAGTAGETVEAGEIGQDGDPARTDDPNTPDESGTSPEATPPQGAEGTSSSAAAGDAPGNVAPEPSAELAAARAEIARLRQERADAEVARFRQAGVIVEANASAAVALLSHDDEGVRRAAGTLLENTPARITLGRARGRVGLSSSEGRLIELDMGKDEVGSLWADLSREEREQRQPEYEAWSRHRRENGIRD